MKLKNGLDQLKKDPWLRQIVGNKKLRLAIRMGERQADEWLNGWLTERVDFFAYRDFANLDLNLNPFEAAETHDTDYFKIEIYVFYHHEGEAVCQSKVKLWPGYEPEGSWVDSNSIANVGRRVTLYSALNSDTHDKKLIWDVAVVKTTRGEAEEQATERYELYRFPDNWTYPLRTHRKEFISRLLPVLLSDGWTAQYLTQEGTVPKIRLQPPHSTGIHYSPLAAVCQLLTDTYSDETEQIADAIGLSRDEAVVIEAAANGSPNYEVRLRRNIARAVGLKPEPLPDNLD